MVDAARRARSQEREISGVCIEGELRAIVAAADSGEPKIADEALGDAGAYERCQRFVFGRNFGAIQKGETAQFQFRVGRERERHVSLTDEAIGVVLAVTVGREIGSTEAELPRTSGLNRASGKIENRVLRAFDEPFETFGFLAQANA